MGKWRTNRYGGQYDLKGHKKTYIIIYFVVLLSKHKNFKTMFKSKNRPWDIHRIVFIEQFLNIFNVDLNKTFDKNVPIFLQYFQYL